MLLTLLLLLTSCDRASAPPTAPPTAPDPAARERAITALEAASVASSCECCCNTGDGTGASRYLCSTKSDCEASPIYGSCVAKSNCGQ